MLIISTKPLKTPLEYLQEKKNVPEICEIYGLSKLKFFALYKADLIIFIKKLTSEGKTRKKIAKIMGISFDSVKKLKKMNENDWKALTEEKKYQIIELSKGGINTKGISSELKIPIDWVYDALKNDILLTYIQNNLDKVIKKFGMDARTITKIIEQEGLVIPSTNLATRIIEHYGNGDFPFYKPISSNFKSKIEGEIEGDGHIRKNRDTLNPTEKITVAGYKNIIDDIKMIKKAKNLEEIPNIKEKYNNIVKGIENVQVTSFQMTKAIKELPWVEYLGKCFEEEGYKVKIRIYETNCYLEVQSSVQLQELRDKWYKDGVKIIPDGYKHNPTNLLHEYEGDGNYGKKENRINLSTENFTKQEVQKISNDINQEIGIHTLVHIEHDKRQPGNEYWRIDLNRNADVEKFFQYLEKADKESLEMAKKTVPHKFPEKFLHNDEVEDDD